jgi:hypothetical protein
MKEFFIVLSALAALMLCVVPAQALVGSPDNVPGSDAVVPFIADISGSTGLNTLIVLMDVEGGWDGTTTAAALNFHYNVNTVRSVSVYDANITGSAHDVVSLNAFGILADMSSTARTALEVDIDGDGTNDHYAGYLYIAAAGNNVDENNTVGQFYFVNLAAGKAAAANIAMKEWSVAAAGNPTTVQEPFRNEMVSKTGVDVDMELFSANAMLNAQRLQAGLATAANAANFAIYPRFYIADATAVNWMLYWMSANDIFATGVSHANVYNTVEGVRSTNIPLDNEMHVYDVESHLPTALWTAYPHEGFIDFTWATGTAALRTVEVLGWVYQQATGTASESWTVMTPMWRNVD